METDGPRANAVDIGENRLAKCRLALHTGQTPVLKYNRQLMQAILWDRLPIAKIVNVKVIGLEQAPEGYKSFDAGVANKFVIDPHRQLGRPPDAQGCDAFTSQTELEINPPPLECGREHEN